MHPLINSLQAIERLGEIEHVMGLKLIANGPPQAFIGEVCDILDNNLQPLMQAEVIGFKKGAVYLMPYDTSPLRMGQWVRATGKPLAIAVGDGLLGQIVDAFAKPITPERGHHHLEARLTQNHHINPLNRAAVTERLTTGIHAIDSLLPLGKGQRIGLFAGSGVGKSMLLGKIAKHSNHDINVIALIGERGREVKDFIHHHMDEATRKRSVLVVACSDESALRRRQAVFSATTIAEYFCQQGKDVMLLMDSITRFAMAQREISLNLGEPPTARGYTPSVFSLLPGIVERAGNFTEQGSITAIYTVLVEGDDFNEPIADHMRSLLDGHVVLTRELAQRGHYPAISVLQSISRLSNRLFNKAEQTLVKTAYAALSLVHRNKDLIEVGAYKPGHHLELDKAIEQTKAINTLLLQEETHFLPFDALMQQLKEILT